ncbi:MAG: MoaD/ThiS family protein [Chloroflexi bacterium]|nr:MoaD/ThiS family protein [Chloroflexota bacterium]
MSDVCELRIVTVELFGMARRHIGEPSVAVELGAGATLRDLTRELARQFPQLEGSVIAPGASCLMEPNVYNLDGRSVLSDLDQPVPAGAPLCLMFIAAGG